LPRQLTADPLRLLIVLAGFPHPSSVVFLCGNNHGISGCVVSLRVPLNPGKFENRPLGPTIYFPYFQCVSRKTFGPFWPNCRCMLPLIGPIFPQLIDFLSMPFWPDSVEPLITAQLRGNCTLASIKRFLCRSHKQCPQRRGWKLFQQPK
jgi:hypothetical protein